MINLLHAEFYKLRRTVAFKVSFLVSVICAIFLMIISHGVAIDSMEIDMNTVSGLSDIFILSVLGPLMAGILICNDFDNKNIHDAVTCGRRAIVMSKSIIFVLVIALLALPYAIAGFIGFLTQGEYSPLFNFSTYTQLMANPDHVSIDIASVSKSVRLLFVSLLLYAARAAICIPIAFKVRKSVVVTVIGVLFGFIVDLLITSLSKIKALQTLLDYIPYSYRQITMDMSEMDLFKISIMSIVFILIMVGITNVSFKKAEIK